MKLRFGKIPENVTFEPEHDGWMPMKEPSPWLAQLLALPIAAATAVALAMLWSMLNVRWPDEINRFWLIAWIIGLVIVHEVIHGIVHPSAGTTSNTVFGFWPSKLMFYAHYDNVLTRNRFIAILLGPFIFLSLTPIIGASVVGAAPFHLAFVSVFNSLLSCVDILGAILLMTMVPKRARVRNKGWYTFYRMVKQSPAGDVLRAAPEE